MRTIIRRARHAAASVGLAAALAAAAASASAQTLRYGGTTPPLTMDPHATNDFVTSALVRQVYDSLVGLEDDMELVAGHRHRVVLCGRRTPGASSCGRA